MVQWVNHQVGEQVGLFVVFSLKSGRFSWMWVLELPKVELERVILRKIWHFMRTLSESLTVLTWLDTDALSWGDWNIVYATPISPGRSRVFVRVVFEVSKVPAPMQQIFQVAFSPSFPAFITHLSNHRVLEDDNIFLHHQGLTMAPDGKQESGIEMEGDWDVWWRDTKLPSSIWKLLFGHIYDPFMNNYVGSFVFI